MNILEQKQAASNRPQPTDKVLWDSCIIFRKKKLGPWFKQIIQGTMQRRISMKLGKKAIKRIKKLTHNRRHYFEARNSNGNAEAR